MKFLPAPRYCVWELTLACNARCVHCGSRAGSPRPQELTADEALSLCDALAELGVGSVTLSGGEPLLRPDWEAITRRLVAHGVTVDMISNGLALEARTVERIASSGLSSVTLSIDGPAVIHDELRGLLGAYRRSMQAAQELIDAGVKVGAATQISTVNLPFLREIEDAIAEAGFCGWQLQLTDRLGRCEDYPELPLEPSDVPDVVRFVLEAQARGRVPCYAADNIGWMLPSEPRLRSIKRPTDRFFCGCQAGLAVLGLTSEGVVRGCLSMPAEFDEVSVRDTPLRAIWEDPRRFAYNRCFDEAQLASECAACAFRRVCRGGCKSLSWAATRSLSHNPFCARLSAQASGSCLAAAPHQPADPGA